MKDDPSISRDTQRDNKKQKLNAVTGIKEEKLEEDENPNNVSNLSELQKEFENQSPDKNDNLMNQLVDSDLNNINF